MSTLQTAKPSWSTPRLVVLGRGHPEEAVLATCKLAGALTSGSYNDYGRCEGPKHAGLCGKCKTGGKS